jgi:hypothetical protein
LKLSASRDSVRYLFTFDKRQQIGIDLILVGGTHAVRQTRKDFED